MNMNIVSINIFRLEDVLPKNFKMFTCFAIFILCVYIIRKFIRDDRQVCGDFYIHEGYYFSN